MGKFAVECVDKRAVGREDATRVRVGAVRRSQNRNAAGRQLTPRVLVQRPFDTLGGRNLGLGIVDRRFGQLGGPISRCDCI
jgi:hypothetical protein